MTKAHILEKTESFVIRYPEAVQFTDDQLSIFWLPNEVNVEKDINSILTEFSESAKPLSGLVGLMPLTASLTLPKPSSPWVRHNTLTYVLAT